MGTLTVHPVRNRRELKQFILFPWKVYKGDPNWVPPLIVDMKEMLDKKKNPFFLHSDAEFFLARRDGEVVGRIAAIQNNRHNEFHKEKTGFFGFFEVLRDYDAASALFDAAASWLKDRGLELMRGPANYSTNDTVGFLLEGFERPPVVLMTYNPPYYLDFCQRYGFQKAKDLYAYLMTSDQPLPEKAIRVAESLKRRENVEFRTVNMKRFWEEVELVFQIYNDAWSLNWGFVPLTREEIDHIAKQLKMILDPDLVLIALVNGEPAGFSLALPDINQALIKIRNGRLFPFGLPKLLWYMRKINGIRVFTMGVVRKYQKRGIDSLFYVETYRRGVAKGHRWGEFSWILEDNVMMNRAAESLGARVYKRYRIYDKPLV
jgi:GNAT superfamily N-acetyltransferase